MKKIWQNLLLLLVTYPIAMLIGFSFFLARAIGMIKVAHWERFPYWQKKLIVVSNHPSLLETVLVPALFFNEYALSPFKYAPWSTPDSKNFYNRWYWFWARSRSVPIDRIHGDGNSFMRLKAILDQGGIVVIFAEGGRTFRGKEFLYSRKGKKIRKLKDGASLLVARTGASILPIWVEGTDVILPNNAAKLFDGVSLRGRATIKIGKVLQFGSMDGCLPQQITQKISNALLELADE